MPSAYAGRCTIGLQTDNKVNTLDYYKREASQLTVAFGGNLAKHLGIDGTFDWDVADRLFRGMKPGLVDGKEQKLTLRIDKDRVGAWDWTFTCPKSVSVCELVGGDSRIAEVRTEAEQAALRYGEQQARVRVRKSSQIEQGKPKTWKYPARYTDNWLHVGFRHTTARDTMPNAHTHYVIFNLSHDAVEGNTKAIELRYLDRAGMNDVYRAELRKSLHRLGYKTEKVGQEFEICGFPSEIKAHYSQRNGTIRAMEAEYEAMKGKPLHSKTRGKLSRVDRPEKQPDVPIEQRRKGWLSRLTSEQTARLTSLVKHAYATVRNRYWDRQRTAYFERGREPEIERPRDRERGLER